MKAPFKLTHDLGYCPGLQERTPIQVLEMLASNGQPDAMEILRNIPYHKGKVGRSEAEETAINAQIEEIVVRIYTMIDLEIRI